MQSSKVKYQYVEKKIDPFWWILFSYIISVLFLFSIFMIVGPIKVFSNNINLWSGLLMLLIPLGIWLGIKVFSYARGLIWRNNHLTTYKFYPDTIQLSKWENTYDKEPTLTEIELSTIQKVVVAPYITNEYRTQHGNKHTDISYILYIIHDANYKKELLMVPFPMNYENIDIWLTYFKEQNISLQFTTEVLYSNELNIFTDEERMRRLESHIHVIPLDYKGNWKQQQKEMYRNWNQTYPPEEHNIEPVGKDKSLFRPIANAVLFSYALMIGITFGLIELCKNGWFAVENPWPIFVMFFLISLLFFFILRHYLRWYFMLIFVINVFVFGIATTMSFEENESIAYQVSENVLGMAILFPLVVWIPYLIVKVIRKAQSARLET
ncbi:hypothetical protein ACTWP4_07750 [Gracilibacillus sp. D59]|uniref:hypothetical protein n=1 Tax=Gracilibacillus sp. D59 TaxID=3457434 RepID=UPI003FCDCC02